MIIENTPQFLPSGKGLGAAFAVNFANDTQHQLRCDGTWQGDPVKGRSLFVDNYDNNFDVRVTGTNITARCPAYSYGYVDISSTDFVVVSADVGGTVNMTVDTGVYAYGFTARGNAPSGSEDPYAALVAGLYHCEGQNNSAVMLDSSIGGFGSINVSPNIGRIDTTYKKFGTSSLEFRRSAAATSVSPNTYTLGQNLTIEGFIRCPTANNGNGTVLSFGGYGLTLYLMVNFGTWKVGISGGAISEAAYSQTSRAFVHFAIVQCAGQTQLYINGVLAGSGAVVVTNGAYNMTISDGGVDAGTRCNIDELRITNAARYLVDFTPPVQAFSL
jgi:hypothetical protein